MSKHGALEWEYLAAFILVFVVIILLLLLTTEIKTIIAERTQDIITQLLGGLGLR